MTPAPCASAKILLVDDRPANLIALEAVLGDSGYQLIRAHSGRETFSVLEQHPDVAVVLLDVQMPEMDGFEVSRRIKQMPAHRDLPVVLITAIYCEDPFVRQGYEAGAIDYFGKPFDPEILKLKVGIYASFRERANLLKERERQLKESEELLETGRKLSGVLENLPVGVIIADHEGRICQMNEPLLKILHADGPTADRSYGELLRWWDSDGQLLKGTDGSLMRALLAGQDSHHEVLKIRCLNGSFKTVFTSASPLRGLDQHIRGAVVVVQDVTAHREIEADLEKRIVNLVSHGVELEALSHRTSDGSGVLGKRSGVDSRS